MRHKQSAAFSHPHVVTIHDFGITARGRGFLVMELLEGRTLRVALEEARSGLLPSRVVHLLRGLCAAVDAAHRRRLVHRDLKPENVFLATVEGVEVAKVLDFGIAKTLQPAPGTGRETSAGTVLGTPEYMAPEQLRGEEAGPAWDIWALGVLAFEMLTGRHPFSTLVAGGTAPALPAAHAGLLAASLAGLEPGWSTFFASALAIDAGARPPSAGDLCREFERALRRGAAVGS